MSTRSVSAARAPGPTGGGIPPRFRRDLEILAAGNRGAAGRFVRNPKTGTLFEIGEKGAFLCRWLDGATTSFEIRRRYQERFGQPLSAEELDVFVGQLSQAALLEGTEPTSRRRNFAEALDPEVFLPLGQFRIMQGDRLVASLSRAFAWCFTRPFHAIAIAVVTWAMGIFVVRFWELCGAVYRSWDTEFLLWTLAASSVLIQSPRALVHGVLCKRYGRQISGIGVALLYYVLPTLYVDWGDIVWVRERSKRFWAVFSGIYFQGLVWAIATIGWHLTVPGGAAHDWFLVLWLAAGGGLLLMNGNPLVGMDAYLLLSAYFEVPNLRPRSLALFGAWVKRDPDPEPITRRARRWMIFYGCLAFVYGIGHLAVMLAALWYQLTMEFEGAGALVVLLATLYMAHKLLGLFLRRIRWVRWLFARQATRVCWVVRGVLAVAILAIAFFPYPYHTGGPFQLLPAGRVTVRAEIEGLVEEVLVREGQWVEAGQPVARIAARRYEAELKNAEARMQEAEARLALLQAGSRAEAIAKAQVAVATAETRLAYAETLANRAVQMRKDTLISDEGYSLLVLDRDRSAALLEEARADLAAVRAGVRDDAIVALESEIDSLAATVTGYRQDMERTTVTSPIAGRVVTPRIEELAGVYLSPGQRDTIMDIEDPRTLHAEVRVREEDAGELHAGLPVIMVTWAFHDRPMTGRIVTIAPVAGPPVDSAPVEDPARATVEVVQSEDVVKSVRVVTEVPNPDNRLQPGMTGFAKIALGHRPFWDVMLRPVLRWFQVEFWSWMP